MCIDRMDFLVFRVPDGQNHSKLLSNITRDNNIYGKKKKTYFNEQQKKLSKIKVVKLEKLIKVRLIFLKMVD